MSALSKKLDYTPNSKALPSIRWYWPTGLVNASRKNPLVIHTNFLGSCIPFHTNIHKP
jgi:hypothetical protein